MKTMTYRSLMMAGAFAMMAVGANAAGASAGAGVGVGVGGAGATVGTGVGVNAGEATSGGSMGMGVGARGTDVDAGRATSGGELGLGVNGTATGGTTGSTHPSGVIDDTGRSGTSSISTHTDANARAKTTGRGGTLSGRPSTLRASSRLGVTGGVSGSGTTY